MKLKEYVDNLGRGGIGRLAEGVGITPCHVYHLLRKSRRASPKLALKIEKYSRGMVKKDDLIWYDTIS